MNEHELIAVERIQNCIYTIRSLQVIVDSDLAELYGVEVKVLNQAVKRNINRFPEEFMFRLSDEEYAGLRSQIVTSNQRGGRRYQPYVFTEQGVAMLSAVLRSETAIKVSIRIMNAFVAMRRFFTLNAHVFQRVTSLEVKQTETDRKIDEILNAIERKNIQPKQGIFYDGQIFDAYRFVSNLFRNAKRSIVIIDNFVDDTVLTHLVKRPAGVKVTIFTRKVSKQLELDAIKFNQQYPPIEIREFVNSHDRFIIIDENSVYHFGASLKDLGKKWFAFSKMDIEAVEMLGRIGHLSK